MSKRTVFLSKLIGLFCVLIALPMIANKQATLQTVGSLLHDAPAMYLAGVLALGVGLAMVLSHNIWSGGALPVTVTVIGWLSLTKGLVLVCLPTTAASGLYLGGLHYAQFYYCYTSVLLILGLCLTYGGFRGACCGAER